MTANLSIGLKTDSAKASLRELKTWMVAEMKGLAVQIDGSGVGSSLKAALKAQKAVVGIDAASLRADVSRVLNEAFAPIRRVSIDSAALTAQVRAAIEAGTGGIKLNVGATGAAPAGAGGASLVGVRTTIQQVLQPAVDELAKATAVLASAVKTTRAAERTGSSRNIMGPTRERLFALQDRDDLVGGRELAKFGPDRTTLLRLQDKVLADTRAAIARETAQAERQAAQFGPKREQLLAAKDRADAAARRALEAELRRAEREGASYGPDRETLLRLQDATSLAARKALDRELRQAEKAAAQFGPDRETLYRLKDRAAAAERALNERERLAAEKAAAAFGPSRERLLALQDAADKQRRTDLERQMRLGEKEAAAFGPNRETLLRLQDQVAERKRRDAERALRDAQREAAQYGPSREDMYRLREQARAAEMRNLFNTTRFNASSTYNGRGASIAGASALVERYGEKEAAAFLRNDGLVQAISKLEQYRKAGEGVVVGHKALTASMNDAHAAARGLAGSMGMLWATYGATVPLVAAAALGAALRSTFTVGKDLEYQLTFVKVLTDGTTISMREFGNAVRGSMVLPTEAGEAMRALAQNGLSAKEALAALPVVLNLATAGEMQLAEAALGATGVMAAFNLQVSDLGRVGDVFAKAAALSNTSVSAMVEAMKQASTVSDQYHVSLEDTAAALAVMAKRNIEGSAAGTAFRNMMTELATPTKRAREAMKELGLELYDVGTNKLRSYSEVIQSLKQVTVGLNEQGRLTFLRELFDERGAKAANAILSDYQLLGQTLDELKNKSKGFTQEVVDALGDTTEGKLKKLLSEFQLSAAEAFNGASSGVNNFIDALRAAAGSDEFKRFLEGATRAVLSLTNYLMENGKVIAYTVAGWVALRAALVGLETVATVVTLFNQLGIALTGVRVAAIGALSALTGGVALITVLAAEWLFLSKNTTKAEEAHVAYMNSLKIQNDTADRTLQNLQTQNSLLATQIDLMYRGVSAADAKRQAEGRERSDKVAEQQSIADGLRRKYDDAATPAGRKAAMDKVGIYGLEAYLNNLKAEADEAQRAANDLRTKMADIDRYSAQFDENNKRNSLLQKAQDYNRRVAELNARPKAKEKFESVDIGSLKGMSNAEVEARLKALDDSLNKTLPGYTAKERPDMQARKDELAESRQIIQALRDQEAATKQQIKFARELNEARYSADVFGPYMASRLAEQAQTQEQAKLVELEAAAVAKLNLEKLRPNLTQADRTNIETEIRTRQANLQLLRNEAEQRATLLGLKARDRQLLDQRTETINLQTLSGRDQEQLQNIRKKYDNRTENGAEQAHREAELQVENNYRAEILKKVEDLKLAREGVKRLEEEGLALMGPMTEAQVQARQAAEDHLAIEQRKLTTLQAQQDVARLVAGATARAEYDRSQTAEFGWSKFWKEYVENGTSSAKIVENVMKSSTTTMQDAFGQFAVTGKANMKSLVTTVIAEAARMMASRAITQLIGLAFSFFGSTASGPGVTLGGVSAGGSAGGGFWGDVKLGGVTSAKGNVMTDYGPAKLHRYESGGVAYSPQVSIFGEGRKPEAYVPLEDGRTIPVTVSGVGGGGDNIAVTLNIHLHGASEESSGSSSNESGKAAQLGRMIETSVRSVLVKEQRPGGLLYSNN